MKRSLALLLALLCVLFSACSAPAPEPTPTPTPKPTATARPTPTPYVWEMEDTPRSSAFSSIGYDAENEVLHVVFRESGIEYVYYEFTLSDWNDFYNAESLGKHFNAYIKGHFDYKKIG